LLRVALAGVQFRNRCNPHRWPFGDIAPVGRSGEDVDGFDPPSDVCSAASTMGNPLNHYPNSSKLQVISRTGWCAGYLERLMSPAAAGGGSGVTSAHPSFVPPFRFLAFLEASKHETRRIRDSRKPRRGNLWSSCSWPLVRSPGSSPCFAMRLTWVEKYRSTNSQLLCTLGTCDGASMAALNARNFCSAKVVYETAVIEIARYMT
jgi:hypothetical protein